MIIYAEILNSKIRHIGSNHILPVFPEPFTIVDITKLDPQPKEGYIYDPATSSFVEPPVETQAEEKL